MSQIKFISLNYDQDGDFTYRIVVTNDIVTNSLEFYGYFDTFQEFAQGLLQFPQSINDSIMFQVGEDDKKWAYYMLLKVFCYEGNGHTAIQIILDNHQPCPDTIRTEFYIKTVPASINNLGRSLSNWNPKIEHELIWIS